MLFFLFMCVASIFTKIQMGKKYLDHSRAMEVA